MKITHSHEPYVGSAITSETIKAFRDLIQDYPELCKITTPNKFNEGDGSWEMDVIITCRHHIIYCPDVRGIDNAELEQYDKFTDQYKKGLLLDILDSINETLGLDDVD